MIDKNDLLHFSAKYFSDRVKRLAELTKILNNPNYLDGKQIKIVKRGYDDGGEESNRIRA